MLTIRKVSIPNAGRAAFDYIMQNATSRNYLGKFPLPPYVRASIRRYYINGGVCFILDSYDEPVCIWDITNNRLINAAKRRMSFKHVDAFYRWIEDYNMDNLTLKEIRI